MLHKLEASISDAMGLVAEIEKGEAAADAIGRSAEETAAGLVERVNTIRAVRMSIHFLALNAHLKCCHLGASGGPLSVVAAELRVRAGDLDGAADAVEAQLAELGRNETAQADAQGRASSAIGRLLEEAIAPVRAAAASAGRDLKALADQGEAVSRELGQAVGRLNFQADVIEVLHDGVDQLPAAAGEPEAALRGRRRRGLSRAGRDRRPLLHGPRAHDPRGARREGRRSARRPRRRRELVIPPALFDFNMPAPFEAWRRLCRRTGCAAIRPRDPGPMLRPTFGPRENLRPQSASVRGTSFPRRGRDLATATPA